MVAAATFAPRDFMVTRETFATVTTVVEASAVVVMVAPSPDGTASVVPVNTVASSTLVAVTPRCSSKIRSRSKAG
jgi:hypothetical protein